MRVLTRRHPEGDGDVEWAQGDLSDGTGLAAALEDVDVVLHAATTPRQPERDLAGARHLLRSARQAGVGHVLYVSIVGIDALGFYDYYAAKLAVERELIASGLPYSIQRATQFHEFVAYLLGLLGRGPLLLLPPGITLQPMDAQDLAERLAHAALQPPAGRLPDLAGPEIRSLDSLARDWLRATGNRKVTLSVPLPIPMFRAMRGGHVTSPTALRVGRTWQAWLDEHASQPNGYARRPAGPR
ncbi:SDR family oxidoreductase [Deinococcus pimensis]|uniref:SDR family oxidoreductase n=1 Tax=Deinococcus pimensis TaxID=309888 RepID=UPI0004B29FEF|nr:NAD(P)H-binding protein [Deinococcus pimensis]